MNALLKPRANFVYIEPFCRREFGPNPSGFSFVRCKNIGLAKPLDVVHEFPPAERLYIDKTCS
jgi:hypothetical protein